MTALQTFSDHPWASVCALLILYWMIKAPLHYDFRAYNRHLRSRNIAAQGWPKPPLDADGDVILPKDGAP